MGVIGRRQRTVTTYVLVHGGWSGAHGFRSVGRKLRASGHDVFTHMVLSNRPSELAGLLTGLA
jgi:hypothetical protein